MIKFLQIKMLLASVAFLFGVSTFAQVQLKQQTDFMTPILGINSSGHGVSLNGYYDFETNVVSPAEPIVVGTEAITDDETILGMIEGPSGDFAPAVRVDGVWTQLPASTGLTGDDTVNAISENGIWIAGQLGWTPELGAWGYVYNTQTEEFRLLDSELYEASNAWGINNDGYAVGWVDDLDGGSHWMPAVFAPDGEIILASEDAGELNGINNSGIAVGFLGEDGFIYDINTESSTIIANDPAQFIFIVLTDISENGVVIGYGSEITFDRSPILYHSSMGEDFVLLSDFLADFDIDASDLAGTGYTISRDGNYVAGFTDGPAFMAMGWAAYLDDYFEGGESDGDCGQGNESNDFESMAVIHLDASNRAADDFFVTEGTMNISQIELNIMSVIPFTTMDMFFLHDEDGKPGDRILHYDQMEIPVEPTLIGQAGAFGVYKTFVDIDLDFENGHYWFAPVVHSPVAGWEATSEGTLGEYMMVSDDYGENWYPMEVGGDFFQGVFTIHCGEDDGGENPEDCDQGDVSNPAEADDGLNITLGGDLDTADDFFVTGSSLNIKTIKLNVLAQGWIDQVDIAFYEDDGNGLPGALMSQSVSEAITRDQQIIIGDAFGFNQYEVYINVNLDFPTGHYWMAPHASSLAEGAVYWEQTEIGTLGEPSAMRDTTVGEEWESFNNLFQSVFTLYCEEQEVPEQPEIECDFMIEFDVEPITRVIVAGIDNESDAAVNQSPALEDFTNIGGNVEAGGTYDVTLEGNTNGAWTNYFTVFIKWNEGSSWIDYSMYEIGSMAGSTGTDGKKVEGSIEIPADTADGAYTMRVVKSFGGSPKNPCGTYGWGQAEDYTLVVGELGTSELSGFDFSYYPNPVHDMLHINSAKKVENVRVFNLTGKEIISISKAGNGQIDVNALPTGVYVVRVMLEGGQVETFKIIKK